MLSSQDTIQFSEHSVLYEMLIPKDHLLRKINDFIDFNFVYKELKDKYCPDNGRIAEDPVRMFKYLLLKTIYTLSDVDVVEHSRYDLSYKYFLGMNPEDDVLENELSYTETLLEHLAEVPVLSEIPAVKEKMNLLSEAVDIIIPQRIETPEQVIRVQMMLSLDIRPT